MSKPFNIVVFEGDGIGPEIMRPTISILEHLQKQSSAYTLDFQVQPAGAAHYAKTGIALPEASLKAAGESDAILLSAMGLPDIRYPDGTEISPQIELRMAFDLYAGVRPVTVRDSKHCPIIRPNGERIDFVIIRESTEGLFFSMGKGEVSHEEARETLCITRKTSEKLFDFAFGLARQRKEANLGPGIVTCVDKANVFRAFAFFRSIFNERAQAFKDIEARNAYVDATALWMVQKPWIFDVLVTENMFGDILSDLGAGLMGGLGLAPSADIGDKQAVFQPCHGSAPDIAGKNCANPFAMILSGAMMLEWLGHRHSNPEMVSHANRLRDGVETVLAAGKTLTPDLGGTATTSMASNAVLEAMGA